MSRPIGAVGEYTLPDFIDREAMMMDGGRLYFQLTLEDTTASGALIGVKLFRLDGTFAGRLVQDPDKEVYLINLS